MKKVLVVALVLAMASMVSAAMAFEFTDNFNSYNNGALYGQGSWNKGGSTGNIIVQDGAVKILNGDGERTTGTLAASGLTGEILINFDVMGDGGASTTWGFAVDDITQTAPANGSICRWYGTTSTARGRQDWVGVTAVGNLTNAPTWDHLSLLINTANTTATFSLNGASLGTVNYGARTAANVALGRLSFYRIGNLEGAGTSILIDNLSVSTVPEPGSILALCSGLVGIVGFARRRRA